MLIILDENPIQAAHKVPDKLKFKQLLELCQMICSCGYSDLYKKVHQGKEIQAWIKETPNWVDSYGYQLFWWCKKNINLKLKTRLDISFILEALRVRTDSDKQEISSAIFRYSKGYESKHETNTELPIREAIKEYEKYMKWKGYELNVVQRMYG